MPLYHYRCASCDHAFEALVHTTDGVVTTAVRCPECDGATNERLLTRFSVGGKASGAAAAEPFCGRCGENRPPCSAD